MPKQMRDARITQRSFVLSQHHGLVFRGTVTTYTDTTHFKVSAFPEYGNASDFPDNFFSGYYVYCVWDSGATGASPQGERVLASAYTSADGTIEHDAFAVNSLAVGDEILLVHPSVINASVIADLDEIKGVGFVSADDSLDAISTELDEILDLTPTHGNIAVTAAETNLYIDDAPVKILVGISIKIDTSNMTAGDTYEFREYYKIESGGSYIEVANTITLSGAQSEPLYVMHLEAYRYGIKVTAKKTAGTDRSFKIEAITES